VQCYLILLPICLALALHDNYMCQSLYSFLLITSFHAWTLSESSATDVGSNWFASSHSISVIFRLNLSRKHERISCFHFRSLNITFLDILVRGFSGIVSQPFLGLGTKYAHFGPKCEMDQHNITEFHFCVD
jgi:hypothetical protein